MIASFAMLGCNTAPLHYRDLGAAPDRKADWMAPSPFCEDSQFATDEDIIVDGFRICSGTVFTVAVDDPIFEPCARVDLPNDENIAWLYDGEVARAYLVSELYDGRELVHDDLRGIPIFVDF